RAEDGIDLVALDDLLRLGLGTGRVAARIGDEQLDLAARERVALLLEEGRDALLHLDAALRQRSRLDREQADLEGRALGDGGRGETRGGGAGAGGQHALEDGSPLDCHDISLPGRCSLRASGLAGSAIAWRWSRFLRRNDGQQQKGLPAATEMQARDAGEN